MPIVDAGPLPGLTKHNLGFADGRHGPTLYTPIFSTEQWLWLATHAFSPPPPSNGTLTSRVYRIDKTTFAHTSAAIGSNNYDGNYGHASASVAVHTPTGRVLAHKAGHTTALDIRRSTGDQNTGFTTVTAPNGTGSRADYRMFSVDPYTGDVWLSVRAANNPAPGRLLRWSPGSNSWTQVGNPFLNVNGSYGITLAFAADGTIYACLEIFNLTPGTGFPRHRIGMVRSLDGGTSWQTLAGQSRSLPLVANDLTPAFPTSATNGSVFVAQLGLDANDNPVVVADWNGPGDSGSSMGLWCARWDGSTWQRDRIMPAAGGEDRHYHQARTYQGRIVVVLPDQPTAHSEWPRLVMLVAHPDDYTTWHRYVLEPAEGPWDSCYLDPTSVDLDGVIRMFPAGPFEEQAQVWVAPAPWEDDPDPDPVRRLHVGADTVDAVYYGGQIDRVYVGSHLLYERT